MDLFDTYILIYKVSRFMGMDKAIKNVNLRILYWSHMKLPLQMSCMKGKSERVVE